MPFWIRRPSEAATAPDIDEAYRRGRRDERAARKRHPVLMSGLFVLAAAGAALITLAATKGSFSDGGEVADASLNAAAAQAQPVVEEAVLSAGDAARDAGAAIRDKGAELAERN